MNVELVQGTPQPEQVVCVAARNDYRPDGTIGHAFKDVISDIEPDAEHSEYPDNPALPAEGSKNWIESRKRTLIDHLIDHGHWGPFEHPQATIAIEGISRVVSHQIVRHRHFTYDQQSLRYVDVSEGDLRNLFQYPEFRGDDFDVDREGVHEFDTDEAHGIYSTAYADAMSSYRRLLDLGVPKEQSRKVLPIGIKTNIVMSGNARAWMHILNVRTKSNVQAETRRCAEAIFQELKDWMPYTFEKYDKDVLPLKLNP